VTTPVPPPPPVPPSEPETGGLLGRLRNWFTREVEPRVIEIEGDVSNLKKLGPSILKLADLVEALVKSADPGAAPEVAALAAGAEKVAAEIAEVVAAIEASGV
jgi:hypothetical protein